MKTKTFVVLRCLNYIFLTKIEQVCEPWVGKQEAIVMEKLPIT